MDRKFRWQLRENTRSPDGRLVICFGIRCGYWPCLYAPFIQVSFCELRLDIWHGLPSYK